MGFRRVIRRWPVYSQLAGADPLGRGTAAKSGKTAQLRPRTAAADRLVKSVCPYCAVGCGQNVYVQDGRVTQIEGDPDSPVSRGRLCPKGSASLQLTTGAARQYRVLYRRPFGTGWEPLGLDAAMDMIGRADGKPAHWLSATPPAGHTHLGEDAAGEQSRTAEWATRLAESLRAQVR